MARIIGDREPPLARFMIKLLQTFFDIALWRKGPQDLPASRLLAVLVLVAYMTIAYAGVRMFDLGFRSAVVLVGVDVLMLSAWLWLVLAFFGLRQRFTQTITAILGVGVLLLLLNIAMRGLLLLFGVEDADDRGWQFARFLMSALVLGRIFMLALDRSLLTGIALTIAIVYSTGEVSRLMLNSLQAS